MSVVRSMERPVVLAGRMLDPGRLDETVMSRTSTLPRY
ncbi:MAG: hypothetical protein QOG80_290 [Pseudonocardiales bacterium]|jgi:hypothetical protein|nr:hypothetical protein [Pseudonocardiales bacterium]